MLFNKPIQVSVTAASIPKDLEVAPPDPTSPPSTTTPNSPPSGVAHGTRILNSFQYYRYNTQLAIAFVHYFIDKSAVSVASLAQHAL